MHSKILRYYKKEVYGLIYEYFKDWRKSLGPKWAARLEVGLLEMVALVIAFERGWILDRY